MSITCRSDQGSARCRDALSIGGGIARRNTKEVAMRTLNKNKQQLYYALYNAESPVYETDGNGNIVYDTDGNPIETGTQISYSQAVEFLGNIALSGGEAYEVEYGVDTGSYDAVLVTEKGLIPITETSLIWFTSEVVSIGGFPDPDSADYSVVKVKPSLNEDRYILKQRVK